MSPTQSLTIGEEQIALLEKLCNACAVSGDEGEVRKIVLEELKRRLPEGAAQVQVDPLGSVLVERPGRGEGPRLRVLLDAHMDEIGFMIKDRGDEGAFRFATVGGIDPRQLPGQPVWVGRRRIPGVIGVKPIHLAGSGELRQVPEVDALRIDVGPAAGGKVGQGDWATFATTFARRGEALWGKALDDRLGVATLLELAAHAPETIDLLLAFTVQEEVGLRGAQAAAYRLDPDLALAIDSTPALDLPSWDGTENPRYNTRLGAGPAFYLSDAGTISDPRLVRHFVETAEAAGIPYQFRQPGGGGTDAGAIHKQRAGIPSLSISVPGRYAHTAAGLSRLSDWEHTLQLLHAGLARLERGILEQDL